MIYRVCLTAVISVFCTSVIIAQPLPEIDYQGGARSHPYDVLHMAVDISFDIYRELVFGTVTHKIRSLNPRLAIIRLDAAREINISSMLLNGDSAEYSHYGKDLFIYLPVDIPYNDTFEIVISYSVSPEKGLYFVKNEPNEQDGRDQIWTQGEGEDHHYWIPMYDYPNDLVTSELRATIRSDWKALSNGELVSKTEIRPGETTWHYRMEKPHAPYLIMFAAGDYLVTHDTVTGGMTNSVPLEYWTYPDMPERVKPTFQNTPDILLYLEDLLGVPYPWNKYSQIVIDEFMYGGMENTTATTLNDYALVDENMRLDYNPDGLIAHELAHQWFGDLVTNRSWDHLWIHESFATYLAARYIGYKYGQDAYDKLMARYANGAIGTDQDRGRSPIAGGEGLTANIYGRGAFVLHMLNRLLGEELFQRSIQYFLKKHAHSVVQTNDLKLAFEDVTGYNLDWFFDQWIYGSGMPDLLVTQEYRNDSLELIVEQRQIQDSLTGIFRLPVTLDVYYRNQYDVPGERSDETLSKFVWLEQQIDTLTFPVSSEPEVVVLDAGGFTLKQMEFHKPPSVLLRQFMVAESGTDRVQALVALSEKGLEDFHQDPNPLSDPYHTVGENLFYALKRDSSAWIREQIIATAASLRLPNIEDIIALGLADQEKDVREVAVNNIWSIDNADARVALLRPMLEDRSTDIVASSLESLAATNTDGLLEPLRRLQHVEGHRGKAARAWLSAVALGQFNEFGDRVAWYAVNGARYPTRRSAFETLASLDVTTPTIRESILAGLQAEGEGMFEIALEAAKVHDDDTMKDMMRTILTELSEERHEKVNDLL